MNGIQPIVNPTNTQQNVHCTNCGSTPNMDPINVASRFLSEYYQKVSNNGWSTTTFLFDQNCTVLYRDKHIGNAHDLLNALSAEYARRANYSNLRSKWVVTSSDTMVLNVFGTIQIVNYSGFCGTPVPFTETFVLKCKNHNVRCTHHMFDF